MLLFIACGVDALVATKVVSVRRVSDCVAVIGNSAYAIIARKENGNDIKR